MVLLTKEGVPERWISMPTLQIIVNKKKKNSLDLLGIRDFILEVSQTEKPLAAVEKVHAMPGQGVTSMFNFGGSYFALKMALTCLDVPYQEVTPQAWQKKMLAGTGLGKEGAVSVAKARWPSFPWKDFTQKKQSGISDALLIAEYLRLSERIQSQTSS